MPLLSASRSFLADPWMDGTLGYHVLTRFLGASNDALLSCTMLDDATPPNAIHYLDDS